MLYTAALCGIYNVVGGYTVRGRKRYASGNMKEKGVDSLVSMNIPRNNYIILPLHYFTDFVWYAGCRKSSDAILHYIKLEPVLFFQDYKEITCFYVLYNRY